MIIDIINIITVAIIVLIRVPSSYETPDWVLKVVSGGGVRGLESNPFPHLVNTPLKIRALWGQSSRNHPCPLQPNLH